MDVGLLDCKKSAPRLVSKHLNPIRPYFYNQEKDLEKFRANIDIFIQNGLIKGNPINVKLDTNKLKQREISSPRK